MTQDFAPAATSLEYPRFDSSQVTLGQAFFYAGETLPSETWPGAYCYMVWSGQLSFVLQPTSNQPSEAISSGDIVCESGLNPHEFRSAPGMVAADGPRTRWHDLTDTPRPGAQSHLIRFGLPFDAMPHLRASSKGFILRATPNNVCIRNIHLGFQGVLNEFDLAEPMLWRYHAITYFINVILINLSRVLIQSSTINDPAHFDARMYRAITILLNHLDQNWTVAALAREAGMSRTAFSTRFKEVFGEPPIAALTHARMRNAAHLLLSTNQAVEKIAISCGFGSATHFIRTFCREFGATPARWRQQKAVPT